MKNIKCPEMHDVYPLCYRITNTDFQAYSTTYNTVPKKAYCPICKEIFNIIKKVK